MAGGDHRGQVEPRPAVAARAVGREFVVVVVQAGDRAEVKHAANVALTLARRMSRITSNSDTRIDLLGRMWRDQRQ